MDTQEMTSAEGQEHGSEEALTSLFNPEDANRWALGVGGVALVSLALRRGLLLRALAVTAGAGMIYRAYTGENPIEALLKFRMNALPVGSEDTIVIERSIVIEKPRQEIYRFFRKLENLPRFMSHLESVDEDNGRSHWRAKAPGGMTVEWDAEVLEERPGDLLRWRSVEGSDVSHFGSVQFKDAMNGKGTELTVHLEYVPPIGAVGQIIAKLLGDDPETEVEEDLHSLKRMLEQGEGLDAKRTAEAGADKSAKSDKSAKNDKSDRVRVEKDGVALSTEKHS